MNADTLVDTNIIVYAFDRDEPEKRKKALAAVLALQNEGSATISNQILAEVFSVLSGKKTFPTSNLGWSDLILSSLLSYWCNPRNVVSL